jgi:uncharacterized protein
MMTDFFIPQKNKKDLWYKEPWMLLVVGGPVVVVIAAIATFFIALNGADKVVAKDYYKQAQNINKDIFKDAKAGEYKIQAEAKLDSASGKLQLQIEGNTKLPSTLLFSASVSSAISSEFETLQRVTLSQTQPGQYEGVITDLSNTGLPGNKLWHIKIEADDWRLTADWMAPAQSSLQIKTSN